MNIIEDLRDLSQRADQSLMKCFHEASGGDSERYLLQQRRKRLRELSGDPADHFDDADAQDDKMSAGMKGIVYGMLHDSLYSEWRIMNTISRRHRIEKPPAWSMNDINRYDIGSITEGFESIVRWCEEQLAKIEKPPETLYVTIRQIAVRVGLEPGSMTPYVKKFGRPEREGSGRRPALYDYSKLRPILQREWKDLDWPIEGIISV